MLNEVKKSKSFTLVELLVVIFIIGVLAALIIANVSSTRVKARDAKRKADLKSIQTAIEMYIDANGYPPGTAGKLYKSLFLTSSNNQYDWQDDWPDDLKTALAPYIATLPKDPLHPNDMTYISWDDSSSSCKTDSTGNGARYWYKHDGTTYELNALMEKDCDAVKNDGGNTPGRYEIGTNLNLITKQDL